MRPARGELNLGRMLVKRLRWQGSTLRARSDDFKAELLAELQAAVWPGLEAGTLQVLLDRTFPLEEAEAAHAHLSSNTTFGALALLVNSAA